MLLARVFQSFLIAMFGLVALGVSDVLSASELAPSNVRVTPGDGKLGVVWEPPAERDMPVSHYVVSLTTPYSYEQYPNTKFCNFNSVDSTHTTVSSTQNSYTLTSLQNGQEYCVRVTAYYAGTGGNSPQFLATPSGGEQLLLVSANVVDATLRLAFDELIDTNSVPPTSAFAVVAGGSSVAVSRVRIAGAEVTLTLSTATSASDTVSLSYAVPSGPTAQPLQDWIGNKAPALSNHAVVNSGAASSDATLSALSVSGATLTPAFSSATEQYQTVLPHSVTSVTVTPTPNDPNATVAFSPSVDADTSAPGHQILLGAGQNTLDIVVTAENAIDRKTYTVSLTRSQAPPEPPVGPWLAGRNDGTLRIGWAAPLRDGGSAVIGYKLQWTSDQSSWASPNQAIVTQMVQFGSRLRGEYSITGLQNGTEYRVRIIAYNLLGDSAPSNELTATPISLDAYLRSFMEDEIVAVHGNTSPWLRNAWEHMKRDGKVFTVVESIGGSAQVRSSCSLQANGLHACQVLYAVIEENAFLLADSTLAKILIHEMAHYYDRTIDLSGDNAALAGFRLYLQSLPVTPGNICSVSELYADVFLLSVLPNANAGYWGPCTRSEPARTAEAVAAVRSALSGTMPGWFSTTYGAAPVGPNLERVWADIKNMTRSTDRMTATYQFRNSFGGYCSNTKATESALEDGVARNPWRDGGCVPGAPANVAAVPAGSGKLAVSWSTPASDGGSPIESYRIQWKSGSQQYDTSRQATIAHVAETHAHTIAGLANGTEHSVRIVPYNQNGDGASAEVAATPSTTDVTPPQFLEATVDGDALVLTWNEALDAGSLPAAQTFSVTVAGNGRAVSGVAIAGSAVELTLSSAVIAGEVVSVSYTVPTAPGATRIRDVSHNAAVSLADTTVRNTTAPLSSDASVKAVLFGFAPNSSVQGARKKLSSGDYEAFSPAPWATSLVHLAVEPNHPNATVTFSPAKPAVGAFNLLGGYCNQPGDDCRLYEFEPSVGANVITVSVTAEDGVTSDSFTVTLPRDPRPVAVEFAKATYAVTEGGTTSVSVRLSADPERTVTIPITATPLGGLSPLEYSTPSSVTFTSGGSLTQGVAVTASTDSEAEQGERIVLGFDRLPDGVDLGNVTTATVTLQDEDSTPPVLESATVSGSTLALTYDEALDAGSVPPASAFAVNVAGSSRSVTAVSLSGATVELQLSAAVAPSEPVNASYTVPTANGESKLRDRAHNDAVGFANRSVPNHAVGGVCNRTSVVLDEIVRRLQKNCWEITARDLAMITGLELGGGNGFVLSSLKKDDFSGLIGLKWLRMIWFYNLPSLPRHVFYGLSNLERLFLSSNGLTVLDSDLFSGLSALQILGLRNNRLSNLPDGVFSGLTSLESLYLSENTVDPLPITIGLVAAGDGTFKATVQSAAPFRIELPIVVGNGQLSDGSSTVVIPTGSKESAPIGVSRLPGTQAVTVDIGSLPSLPASHSGYSLVKTGSLPLAITTDAVVGTSEVSIASGSSPVTEGTAATFTLTRTDDTAAALTVDVSVSETGAAVSGTAPATATFAAGSATAELSVATEDDAVVEAASTITATVAAGSGYSVDAGAPSADVAVNDNDAATFTVSASPAQIDEGESSTLTVAIANGVTFGEVQTIALDLAASTTAAIDYTLTDDGGQILVSPYALTLAAGASSVTATVTATDDSEQEPAETIEIAASLDGTSIGSTTIEVAASDALTASFEGVPTSHDGSSVFTLGLAFSEAVFDGTEPFDKNQAIQDALQVTGGTVRGRRRVDPGAFDRWIFWIGPSGNGTVTVTLPATTGACSEAGAICTPNGKVLSRAPSATVPGPASGVAEISIAPNASPVTEGEAAIFTLTRTGDTAAALTVDVNVSETGATVSGTAPPTATFVAGSATAELSVATEDDAVVEAASTITATVAAGTGYDVDTNASSAAVVVNDNEEATFTVSAIPTQIDEGEASTLTVAIANGVTFAADQTIALDFAASNAAAADYSVADGNGQALTSPYTLTLTAGTSSVTVTVTAVDDSEQEPAETIEVAVSLDSTAIGSASIEIAASDALTARFESVPESHDGSASFSFELHFGEEFRIGYRTLRDAAFEVSGGTVTRARRLVIGTNTGWSITIEPDTDGDIAITLPARACIETGAVCTDDDRALAEAVSATVPGPASEFIEISIASGSSPVTEGTAATFTLTRTGGTAAALTVDVSVSETGDVMAGTAPATAAFAAGSATAELSVATEDDEVVEAASTITATVAAGTGYDVDTNASSAEVVVDDDDAAPVVTTVSPVTVAENETVVVILAATDDDTESADFIWAIPTGGTGGADAAKFSLTPAGALSFTAAKDYETPDDADQDGDYEVTVRVTDRANWTDKALIVRLIDVDEIAPTISDASVDADTLTLTFSEALDEGSVPESSAFEVTVAGSTRGVSNVSVSGSTVTLTLASAVVSSATVTVGYTVPTGTNANPLQDVAGNPAVAWTNEAVTNNTSNATPTGLPTISGTARVGETLTASTSGIADGDGLTNATFAWQWVASDGTTDTEIGGATASTYTLTSAEVGKAIKVRVTFNDDGGTEETLVSAATAAVAAAPPVVSIAPAASPVTEGSAASFTLSRAGDTAAALTVSVAVTEAGSVLSGTPASTVTFAAGFAEATLSVATDDDSAAEADGRVTASVVAGTGYEVAADAASAGVDVYDNDEAASTAVETLWTSTLTVFDLAGIIVGRYEGLGGDLTPDGWSEDGTQFRAEQLYYYSGSSELLFYVSAWPPDSGQLTLHLDDLHLRLSEVVETQMFTWTVDNPGWQEGQTVAVKLTRADPDAAVDAGPGVSVADAQVQEAEGALLAFRVTLAEAQTSAVSVRYATSDGEATAGSDYVSVSGALRFAPGETVKTVSVPVLNDAHDEGSETLTLTLSHPFGAEIGDGVATGTIVNTDAMPQAWLARFGRTVADQVLEAVESRMTAPRTAGSEVTLAGQRLGGGAVAPDGEGLGDVEAEAGLETLAGWLRGKREGEDAPGFGTRAVTERDLLVGSSFSFTGGTEREGTYTLWGRGAVTRFDGRESELTLDGEVASGMLGADWTGDALTAGLVISHSQGEGSYRSPQGDGAVSSTLTGLYPWGRYALSERLSLWGVAGYGEGTLTLTPDGMAPIRTDLDLLMAASGLRGVLVQAPAAGGFELAVKTDAMGVQTGTAKAQGLQAEQAEVTRLRLGLEGSRPFRFEGGASLTPSVEIGVRHDGGDAETGFGVDMGGGLAWSDPPRGLSAEFQGRGLLSHDSAGFGERGFSGSLSWDPTPETSRGLSLSMSQTVGAPAAGGMDALLERNTLAGLTADESGEGGLAQRRFEVKLGYGLLAFGDRFTSTPELGLGWSESVRETTLGWHLAEARRGGLAFGLDVEAARRENTVGDQAPGHRLGLGFGWRLEGAGVQHFELRFEGARTTSASDDSESQIGVRATARW